MRYFLLTAGVVSFFFLLTGCEFSVSTASLSEPALALKVDEKTQAPLEKVDDITPETGTIYATIKVKNAPGDTQVKAVFFYKDTEERQIAENTIAVQGTQYISFSLTPPDNGWPVGEYRVQFYLDGEPDNQLRFHVRAFSAPETGVAQTTVPLQVPVQEKQQEPARQAEYKRLEDKRFGFSFEVPAAWSWKVIPDTTDYLISGPGESESGEITVIVQIIDTRLGGVGSLQEQMLDLVNQISALQEGAIVKKDQFRIAGKMAPFFISTYQANNSARQQVEFGHTQLGVKNSPFLLLVSYAAPRDIYQRQLGVFQHMMDTFVLQSPSQ